MKPKKIKISALPNGSHYKHGTSDNAGRWYPDQAIRYPGTFDVRQPTRKWPHSYTKHYYSTKFAKAMSIHDPARYISLQGIDPESEHAQHLYAAAAAYKIGGIDMMIKPLLCSRVSIETLVAIKKISMQHQLTTDEIVERAIAMISTTIESIGGEQHEDRMGYNKKTRSISANAICENMLR